MTTSNRMQFLRGDFAGRQVPIRPPWSLDEGAFVEHCNRCGDCMPVCPQHLLVTGRGGFPQVDFSQGACLFCGECRRVCPTGALQADPSLRPWALRVEITASCLAQRGVECRVCGEVCEAAAIRIRLQVGGPAQPSLETSKCNGCGACIGDCPVQAIEIRRGHRQESVK